LRGEQVLVDAAVGVAQAGELRVVAEQAQQPFVVGLQVQLVRGDEQHAFAHQLLQRLAAHLGRLEQARVGVGHLAAQAFDVALVRGVPLGPLDALAVDLGHRGLAAVGVARVALDPEDDERREDDQHDDAEHQARMGAEEFEHLSWKQRRRTWVRLLVR
jgi:hypothetical protein